MSRLARKPRKPVRKLADLARQPVELQPLGRQPVDFVPEWTEIKEMYSVPEIIEAVKAAKGKTSRTVIPNKQAILDAAAHAKVRQGRYTQIARRWKLAPKQLIDLVGNNRDYFNAKVDELRKSILSTTKQASH